MPATSRARRVFAHPPAPVRVSKRVADSHSSSSEQPGRPGWLEVDEQVDVAVRSHPAAESRAEEAEAADAVRGTDLPQTVLVDAYSGCQSHHNKSRRSITLVAATLGGRRSIARSESSDAKHG